MIKKISPSVLALLALTGVSATPSQSDPAHTDQAIQLIKKQVDFIYQSKVLVTPTIPDQVEQNWDQFQEALEDEVENRMEAAGEKLKQTFQRYKEEMEKSIVRDEIGHAAWEGSDIKISNQRNLTCDMDCVSYCFTDYMYRYENVLSTEKYCIYANCNCESGRISYTREVDYSKEWQLSDFGTDRDLYDVNGTQIYYYVNGTLYHRDYNESTHQWEETSHIEQDNTTHSEEIRSLENYHDILEKYQWTEAPISTYSIVEECDLQCSEECMQLRGKYSLAVVDNCQVNRCNCYYSSVNFNTCDDACMQSCLLVSGGEEEITKCLQNLCLCQDTSDDATTLIAQESVIAAPNKLELAAKKTYDIAKALGYGGFEAYFSKTNGSLAPEAKIPIVAISIAVAIFSIMILGVYWYLRRKEKRRAKKTQVLGYEDKSSYSQKLHFLNNQEVSVSSL